VLASAASPAAHSRTSPRLAASTTAAQAPAELAPAELAPAELAPAELALQRLWQRRGFGSCGKQRWWLRGPHVLSEHI
jgi:hypothetical protein